MDPMVYQSGTDERRRFQRIQIATGAYVSLWPALLKVGEIIDISKGGLAFRYAGQEELSEGPRQLDIFFTRSSLILKQIPVVPVSDRNLASNGSQDKPQMRRCSVAFKELPILTQSQIEALLQSIDES
jgi:hypothetical protein